MGELIVIDQATEVVSEAAQATVHAGVALIKLAEKLIEENPKLAGLGLLMIAAGVGYGLATGIPEFFKNSYFRWGTGEAPKPAQ